MQVAIFQSVKMCNWASKSSVTQTPLIGYFVSRAKRDPRSAFFRRGKSSYSLPWGVTNPAFLLKVQAALALPQACRHAAANSLRMIINTFSQFLQASGDEDQIAVASKFPNLQMRDFCFSSEEGQNCRRSRIFEDY